MNSFKTARLTIVILFLGLLLPGASALAEDELKKPVLQDVPADTHLSMHQFRHELGAFGTVEAYMSHEGVLTIHGHVDDGITRSEVERLARKVKGVVEVRNLIFTD